MTKGVTMIVCDSCLHSTEDAERGWRAYVTDGELEIFCPYCAEVVVGEDEAAWSD
jgi:hypothetical protein